MSVLILFQLIVVASWISRIYSDIPYPTGFGTKLCKKWPFFYLQDYNPSSRSSYLQTYGLNDIKTESSATVVGLYFADSEDSFAAIQYQDRLTSELQSEFGISIHNVAINYFAPKECAKLECIPIWTLSDQWWYYTNSCEGYVGGCAPGDERLQVDNWQGVLTSVVDMPFLQDTYWVDAWERFGGGEGDIFIYDSEGRLFSVFCTVEDYDSMPRCGNIYKGGAMLNDQSYPDLKKVVVEAAKSDSFTRCEAFDDYYYQGYATYYSTDDDDDDAAPDDDNDDDDDDDDDDTNDYQTATVNPNPNPQDDDNSNIKGDNDDYFDDDDDDGPTNRFNLGFHNHHKKMMKKVVPAASIAVLAGIIVACLGCTAGCFRWHRLQAANVMGSKAHSGATKFSRLPTTDDDVEYADNSVAYDGDVLSPQQQRMRTAQGSMFEDNGRRYGSL